MMIHPYTVHSGCMGTNHMYRFSACCMSVFKCYSFHNSRQLSDNWLHGYNHDMNTISRHINFLNLSMYSIRMSYTRTAINKDVVLLLNVSDFVHALIRRLPGIVNFWRCFTKSHHWYPSLRFNDLVGTYGPDTLEIPACIRARAWRTCRDACRDR